MFGMASAKGTTRAHVGNLAKSSTKSFGRFFNDRQQG